MKGHFIPHSKEAKKKMREAKLKNPTRYWLNKNLSEGHKVKLSEAHKGKPSPRKGVILSDEIKEKVRKNRIGKGTGKNNANWKDGITKLNDKIRGSSEMNDWRRKIFKRDDYRCFDCGEKELVGGKLESDHIFQFSKYPRLRFMIENGQTLCKDCHKAKTIYERTGVYTI